MLQRVQRLILGSFNFITASCNEALSNDKQLCYIMARIREYEQLLRRFTTLVTANMAFARSAHLLLSVTIAVSFQGFVVLLRVLWLLVVSYLTCT